MVAEKLTPARFGQSFPPLLVSPAEAIPLGAAADYKGGLQVGVPEGSLPSQDGCKIQHLHRWHVIGCLAHIGNRALVSCISAYNLGTTWWREVAAQPMNLVAMDKTGTRVTTITAREVLVHLRAAAIQYGEARLGFPASRIAGTHSLRAGAAMAMFLAGIPVEIVIQLIGQWRSQTFMHYFRLQVQ